ncbi:MAG: tRNA (guanosine(37)-N1)-methyltransferase TrmD [Gammaproteobacteria bacterium]|nr:tRNA (guanosine(37)-N1)-methyltransferase TrmD [Gammaproteobacteria bacterium]MBU1628875.1 tRNA (guanosine(37)-N1)-methyltransferase TrmD [Gammaproteobacteria bacterium]MBU1926448.1 tRNA (guanosine(37)-N1)-methyltransferase TrmD [Gammaproteobacteria bacterium]
MKIGIITLFPELFSALHFGVLGRAIEQQRIDIQLLNPRDFTHDKYHTVDDKPYGGGPGMLMKVQPLQDAIQKAKKQLGTSTKVIYPSPQGKQFDHSAAKQFSTKDSLIFVAGRYEGIDERLLQTEIDEEWSIGDYVLTGGEFPILVMIDALSRFIPGVLGDPESALQDSFANGLLDHPHYTRPEIIHGLHVPKVLLSGAHFSIDRWRMKQALGRTWLKRPDLIHQKSLTNEQKMLLEEFIQDYEETKK